MNKGKDKAAWDVSSTVIFIDLCIEQIYNNERQGSAFIKDGWKHIVAGFNEKTGKSYDRKQLKNRLDSLKIQWRVWDKLFSKETGISYDPAKHMVNADDDWWEKKIKENPEYGKYRYKGLMFARELDILFKGVMASGEKMFTPIFTQQMSQSGGDDGVYRPTMDLEEGSGDSEEDLGSPTIGASMGVTADLEGITLTTNTPPSAPSALEGSGKRKRAKWTGQGSRKKMANSKTIADAISRIADASEDKVEALKKLSMTDLQMSDIVKELRTIPEVASDKDFCIRCCNMMMHPVARDMYVGLKDDKELLLVWLRQHAYSTPKFQKPPPTH